MVLRAPGTDYLIPGDAPCVPSAPAASQSLGWSTPSLSSPGAASSGDQVVRVSLSPGRLVHRSSTVQSLSPSLSLFGGLNTWFHAHLFYLGHEGYTCCKNMFEVGTSSYETWYCMYILGLWSSPGLSSLDPFQPAVRMHSRAPFCPASTMRRMAFTKGIRSL